MELSVAVGFILVAFSNVITPGPNFLLITMIVPKSGRSVGFATVAGVCTAAALHGCLTVFGLSVVIAENDLLFLFIKTTGALYICWLGLKSLITVFNKTSANTPWGSTLQNKTHVHGYFDGLITNALNPYTFMFYLAAFPQFVANGQLDHGDTLRLVIAYVCIHFLWFGLIVALVEKVTNLMKQSRAIDSIHITSGVALIFVGLVFMAQPLR